MIRLLASFLCAAALAAPPPPATAPRAAICLNGVWDVVSNAPGDHVPAQGWTAERAPAMPVLAATPVTARWYRRAITLPRAWFVPGRRFVLRIAKAGHYAAVYSSGKLAAEHYGQYTPFEADLTASLRPDEPSEIAIYVHNASGKYARPGAVVDNPLEGNAYRGAAESEAERNWTGITGDITLTFRPAAHVSDVFVVPSVRRKKLEARVTTEGAQGLRIRAAVLDGARVVLRLPEAPATAGAVNLAAEWRDPELWGPAPWGQPKLYTLRTELVRQNRVVDRLFTRFGFREVWIEGRDVLLNGKKLWMAGTYFPKLAPVRYLNDRRPQALTLEIMRASGLNTLHGHWDELGETWLDLCDEMGILVLGAFYCDGRPKIHSRADSGWADWMTDTCARWTRANRNHPSIVMWRPSDVVPPNISGNRAGFWARLAAEVRREDGTRPLADDTDIQSWAQNALQPAGGPKDYDDGSRMAAALAASTKPFLTKELYVGFADIPGMSRFFRAFYEKSFRGGATGVIVQHMPLFEMRGRFTVSWPSQSGAGNRDTGAPMMLPNWCDPSQPAWTPSAYSRLFADLYREFVKPPAAAPARSAQGELLVPNLDPDEFAVLWPPDLTVAAPLGVRASAQGDAWFTAPPGPYRLERRRGPQQVEVRLAPEGAR